MENSNTKEEFNSIPLHFCKNCLSLNIRCGEDIPDFCEVCGSTDIIEANVKDWEELYIKNNGYKYLDNGRTRRKKSK